MNFENDGRAFFGALQGIAKGFGQAYGLKADAEISAGHAAFFEKRGGDFIYGRSGDDDRAETRETWRGEAVDGALRIDHSAADRGRLQADVKADVRRERGAGPAPALGRDETDDAERCDGSASARAA